MELTQEQLDERIAVLKRLRSLLEQQRAKFAEYLNVLEKQQDKIELDDGDALMAHAELEQHQEHTGGLHKQPDIGFDGADVIKYADSGNHCHSDHKPRPHEVMA